MSNEEIRELIMKQVREKLLYVPNLPISEVHEFSSEASNSTEMLLVAEDGREFNLMILDEE